MCCPFFFFFFHLECESDVFFLRLLEESSMCCLHLRITNAKLNAAGCKCWDNLVQASQVQKFATCWARYRRSCQQHDLTGWMWWQLAAFVISCLPRSPRCNQWVPEVRIATKSVVLGVSHGKSKLLPFPHGLSQQPAHSPRGNWQLSKCKWLWVKIHSK